MKMKQLLMTAALVILSAAAASADDPTTTTTTTTATDGEPMPVFKCNELSLDAFGAYETVVNTPDAGFSRNHWGGGLGINYFFTDYVGIGGESAAFSNTRHFIDYAGGNVFLRYPFQCARVAPYIFGGGGRAFNPNWNWYIDGGAGLEYRICPRLGVFGDARYVWREVGTDWPTGINGRIHLVEARIGVRFITF